MKITKKHQILIISTLFILIYIFFNKLDFLFFKVNICNNTDQKLDVNILDTFYIPGITQKIFGLHKGRLGKDIFIGQLGKNECSGYINMNRLSNYPSISAKMWKTIDGNYLPYKECSPIIIDTSGIRKMKFGTYDYSITGYKFIPNTYKCNLNVKRITKN